MNKEFGDRMMKWPKLFKGIKNSCIGRKFKRNGKNGQSSEGSSARRITEGEERRKKRRWIGRRRSWIMQIRGRGRGGRRRARAGK